MTKSVESLEMENRLLLQGLREMFRNTYPGNGLAQKVSDTDSALAALKEYSAKESIVREQNGERRVELENLQKEKLIVQRYFGVTAPRPGSE
jgi:hypothetical protein